MSTKRVYYSKNGLFWEIAEQASEAGPKIDQQMRKKTDLREFLGGSVVRTPCFHCWCTSSVSGPGTKVPQAVQHHHKEKKGKEN